MTLGFCDCNQGRLPCTCLPAVTNTTPMPACKPPRGESGLRIAAISYSCRNLGQVALLWPGQPAPTGPGWIDVKAEPLVRLSDTFTTEEIDLFRQWFNAVEDLGRDYLGQQDRDLYTKLMRMLK